MAGFIRAVNHRVASRPALGFPNWCERLFLDDKPELVILNTHNGEGHTGPSYLDIINCDPTRTVTLTGDDVTKLSEMTGRKRSDFAKANHSDSEIAYLGGIRVARIVPNILLGERAASELAH